MDQRRPSGHEDEELDLTEHGNGRPGPGGQPPPKDTDSTEGVRIIGAEEAAEAIEHGQRHRPAGRGPAPLLRPPRVALGRSPPRPALPPRPEHRVDHRAAPPPRQRARAAAAAPLDRAPHRRGAGRPPRPRARRVRRWVTRTTSTPGRRIATAGPRWRDSASDWDEPDYDAEAMSHDDDTRVGALDETERPEPDDFFGFDESPTVEAAGGRVRQADPDGPLTRGHGDVSDDFDRESGSDVRTGRPDADPATRVVRTGLRARATGDQGPSDPHPLRGIPDRDVGIAIATGVGPGRRRPGAALARAGLGHGARDRCDRGRRRRALQRAAAGRLPAGHAARPGRHRARSSWRRTGRARPPYPWSLGLTVIATLLWYLIGVSRNQPTMNVAVSLLVVLYVGLLGSFAALILTFPDEHGVGVLIAVVLAVVANDVGALVVGRQWGHARLAPDISPSKTVEGLHRRARWPPIVVTTIAVGIIGWAPFDGIGQALALGLVVAVVAPARRPVRVDDQARPRREGHGQRPARPRRPPRPLRRPAVRPAGGLLPLPAARDLLSDRCPAVRAGAGSEDGTLKRVAVLGSTGSIGTQALDVIRASPDRYEVVALGAASSVDLLAEQAVEFRPRVVAIADDALGPPSWPSASARASRSWPARPRWPTWPPRPTSW